MNKHLWEPHFIQQAVPQYPCPRCVSGHLKLAKTDLHEMQPKYVRLHDFENDPMGCPERFVMLLQCNALSCGEVVAVSGNVVTLPSFSEDSHDYYDYLEPASMIPAPPLIVVPKRVPEAVKKEVELSFQLFWADYRVCASRLRTSLERLMDHFGLARTRIQKDLKRPTKPGKRVPLDLSARIEKLPTKIGTKDYSEILHALRKIGNLGTHGSRVSHSAILDAFRLYEIALERLFEDKSDTAKAIIKRLKAHK